MPDTIVAEGVRVHNLKSIDVTIPTRRLVVVTGVSGSGKSSLAFDTFYAEGQRRYVESLSAYARQFLERLDRPNVRRMEGICPAIAIRQRPPSRNPRSTVATATEIHDYLRLLFAKVGRTHCDGCGEEVTRDTAESVGERLLGLPEGTQAFIGFAVEPGGTPLPDLLDRLQKKGFARLLVGSAIQRIDEAQPQSPPSSSLTVLVDRLTVRKEQRARIVDSVEIALREGGGTCVVQLSHGPRWQFSERFECARCGGLFEEPQPRLLSFNSPYGACTRCHGFGNLIEIDQALVVPDRSKSLRDGAIEPWNKPRYRHLLADLRRFARRIGIPLDLPWSALEEEHRRLVLEGDEEFPGVVGFFRWLESKKYKVQVRVS